MIFAVLGIISATIFLLGDVPYLRDTISGKTRPHKVTWGIATFINAVGFANQYASGATNSLWLFGAGTLMVSLIFFTSFKHGIGSISTLDFGCLAVAVAGVLLWAVLKSPIYSIVANIVVNSVAIIPSYLKAKREPESETKISWVGGAVSCVLATVSVGKWDWSLLILPGTDALLQIYMVYILYWGNDGKAAPTPRSAN